MANDGVELDRQRSQGSHALEAPIFRSLFDAAPDAMVIVRGDGRIQLVNAQVERLFGYHRDELVGQPVEILVPERVHAQHPLHRAKYSENPHIRSMGAGMDPRGRRKDGSEFPAEVSVAPTHTADGVLITAAIRDVTDRRRLEQKMEEALRLKSEFLANMSHELRTPLNAIIGFADLMHRGKVGQVSSQHREYLGDILTSARHLLQLINDILDLARVESGKMEFRLATVNLATLLQETCDILRGLAARKRLQMSTEVETTVREVIADPARLKQVIYNYLSNAIKFTPQDGRIVIRVSPEGPTMFRLAVEDSGIGISPENLKNLFVEFRQLDATNSKTHQGTGLGLALTKRIVEAHGGQIEVRSQAGIGSTFSAILPRQFHLSAEAAQPEVGLPSSSQQRRT